MWNLPVNATEAVLYSLVDKLTVAVIAVPVNQRKMPQKILDIRPPVSVMLVSMPLNSRDSRPESIIFCNSDSDCAVMTRQMQFHQYHQRSPTGLVTWQKQSANPHNMMTASVDRHLSELSGAVHECQTDGDSLMSVDAVAGNRHLLPPLRL